MLLKLLKGKNVDPFEFVVMGAIEVSAIAALIGAASLAYDANSNRNECQELAEIYNQSSYVVGGLLNGECAVYGKGGNLLYNSEMEAAKSVEEQIKHLKKYPELAR